MGQKVGRDIQPAAVAAAAQEKRLVQGLWGVVNLFRFQRLRKKIFSALIIVSAKECRGAAKAYSLGFLTPGQQ
jgi:hypothetical protein